MGKKTLVLRASACNAPGKNFTPLSDEFTEHIRVFIINFEFLDAKTADFLLKEYFSLNPASLVIHFPSVRLNIHAPILPGFSIFVVGHLFPPKLKGNVVGKTVITGT
jgi:hypothetical protein